MNVNGQLRVILLCDRLDRPGAGIYAADLARALCRAGCEVFLIAEQLPEDDTLSEREVPVRLRRRLSAWSGGGGMRRWLLSELRAFGPDVLHVAAPHLARVGRRIARKLGIPGVVTVHSAGSESREWRVGDLRWASIIAASHAVRSDLVNRHRISKSQVTVIYPGVQVPPGRVPRPRQLDQTTIVGTLGTLGHDDGHVYLLQAARKVLDRGVDLRVLVAGRGPEKHALRAESASLGLTDVVTFVEDISQPRSLIDVMDIFVLPTMHEAMGTVVLEAMALGKPVVVSGVGGIFAAVHDNHTGLVFPKGDADALAAAIIRLMLKPDFALRLAREGREIVRQGFSIDAMVGKTLELYGYLAPVT